MEQACSIKKCLEINSSRSHAYNIQHDILGYYTSISDWFSTVFFSSFFFIISDICVQSNKFTNIINKSYSKIGSPICISWRLTRKKFSCNYKQ